MCRSAARFPIALSLIGGLELIGSDQRRGQFHQQHAWLFRLS